MTDRMDTAQTSYSFLAPATELARGSMAAQVAAQLRQAIIALKLPPGTMLDKAQICARLGVSRSPVAEAFARLEAEGLLEILPQRGTVVSFLSFAEVREYIFIRKALEGEAVRVLAARRPGETIEALHANIAAQRAVAEDRDAFHKLDLQFHELLLVPLDYKRMKAMVDTAGKPDPAARAMRRHLDGMISELEALAAQRPELFVRPAPRRSPVPVIRQLATIRRLPST
jgi:DNA-binding GntR family transcriptional regulator